MSAVSEMSLGDLAGRVGQEVGCSRWFDISRARIAAFADVTEDHQPIHLDADAARAAGFPAPIAHGFLTLSMLSPMTYDALPFVPRMNSVNYGFDRLRFIAPVAQGARIRGRFVLDRFTPKGEGAAQLHWQVTVEIEAQDKPALVADWITRLYDR